MKLPDSTEEVSVPPQLIGQVIGQDRAREVVSKAALQKRHVLLIGPPGTGKSMLAQAMAELLPKERLQDVLMVRNETDDNNPRVKPMPAGHGRIVRERLSKKKKSFEEMKKYLFMMLLAAVALVTLYYFFVMGTPLVLFGGIVASVFLLMGMQYAKGSNVTFNIPKLLVSHRPGEVAPFVDATGAHAGSLLGDVRHDPFQAGGLETPAHERVEPGAIHRAHKGVLFIDEIATFTPKMQVELLTALQEKEYPITGQSERSSGAMVRTEPVPCDFVLVAAGNLSSVEKMNPALRSRIRGYGYEVYVNDTMEDTEENREKLVRFVAQEVEKDGRIPHFSAPAVEEIIREAKRRSGRKGHLTLKLRDLGGLVRAAGDIAREESDDLVELSHIDKARSYARSLEQQIADKYIEKKKDYHVILTEGGKVGRVNGLAVVGDSDSGIMLPIEAEVTPGGKKSEIVATGQLGEIAKEAIQNVNAIIMKWYGESFKENYDIYVQFLQSYEGVEGDSASIACATAIISAFKDVPVRQDVAMTGSLSVRGDVLPVGGVNAKLEAAKEAGVKRVLIPHANLKDVLLKNHGLEIVAVERMEDVLEHALVPEKGFLEQLKSVVSGVKVLPKPEGSATSS